MQIEILKTTAEADKYFDAQRLAHGSFSVYSFTRVNGKADSISFVVRFCDQESNMQMTPGVLNYLIKAFSNSVGNAPRFAGCGPEEVAIRGMDRLLPVFMAVRDQLDRTEFVSEPPIMAYGFKREGMAPV